MAEVAIIAAVILTDGWQQWAMITFSIAAFFYVSTWFLWILVNMNWVLYPPKEYGGEVDVGGFVDAMRKRADYTPDADLMRASITEALARPEVIQEVIQALPSTLAAPKADETRAAVTRSLSKAAPIAVEIYAERNFLNFEFAGNWEQISPEDRSITLPYTVLGGDAIAMLHVLARLALSAGQESDLPRVREFVFQYGKAWVLREKGTGSLFPELMTVVTMYRAGIQVHPVRLQTIGIEPGMTLEVILAVCLPTASFAPT